MATPLPLLFLLLLGSAAPQEYFDTEVGQICGGHAHSEVTVQALQCSVPPCTTATSNLTMTLPVLLSLLSNISSMGATLQLYGAGGFGRGLVTVWRSAPDILLVRGAACDGSERSAKLAHQDTVGAWVHVYVVVEGSHLSVRQVLNTTFKTLWSLWYRDDPPTALKVLYHTHFGYSALNVTTTQAPSTTTTTLLYAGVGVATTASVILLVLLLHRIANTRQPQGAATTTTTIAARHGCVPAAFAPLPPQPLCACQAIEDSLYVRVM